MIVVTAANEAQAAGYRAELGWRMDAGLGELAQDVRVVCDPGGKRVGSLAATVNVLRLLGDIGERRILVCHSGGDSKRLPAYAAAGKIFTPMPCGCSLFDLIVRNAASLPKPEGGQLLVLSGDVLLTFDPRGVDFSRPGVTGVAYWDSMDQGSRHGVYVAKGDAVTGFLQKPTPEEARAAGACDVFSRVAVDTGILSLDSATCSRLASWNWTVDLPATDIYEEFTLALVMDRESYLKRFAHKGNPALGELWDAVKGTGFSVNVLPFCEFFHIGSSREFLSGFTEPSKTAAQYGFAAGSGCAPDDPAPLGDGSSAFIFNSSFAVPVDVRGRAVVEGCHRVKGRTILSGDNILTGLPRECTADIVLGPREGLVVVPVGEKDWAAVRYGLDDDFKTPFERGGTYLNRPMTGSGTLWDAPLFSVGDINSVVSGAQKGRARSLKELMPQVNHERLLAVRREIARTVNLKTVIARLEADDRLEARAILADVKTPAERKAMKSALEAYVARVSGLAIKARAARLLVHLSGVREAARWQQVALDAVAAGVQKSAPKMAPLKAAILRDQVVWVTTPVRLDFAGGWSDTPPISTELGGSVLNAAVTLNGQYPVQVMAKLNDRNAIRVSSIDLGESVTYTKTADLLAPADPHAWDSLARAALVLAGIVPSNPAESLSKRLESFGGGLDVTIFSALPKGSGMGTSSILGCALLACLDRVSGEPFNPERLTLLTSVLEQRMSTGGGWQDQIGGMLPGVKLVRTEPGPDQTPSLRWTPARLFGDDFRARSLLYFTGRKRLAKNILKNVVNRYLDREKSLMETVSRLKAGAERTRRALDAQNLEAFAEGVAEYWSLKKSIDPGSTTEQIEEMLARVKDRVMVAMLPGAGGGGFVFMIAKSAEDAKAIRDDFESDPPNGDGRFFDFAIDDEGMKVTVL